MSRDYFERDKRRRIRHLEDEEGQVIEELDSVHSSPVVLTDRQLDVVSDLEDRLVMIRKLVAGIEAETYAEGLADYRFDEAKARRKEEQN